MLWDQWADHYEHLCGVRTASTAGQLCVMSAWCNLNSCLGEHAQPTNGRKAFWRMTYVDDTLRMLYTNKGNLFILTRSK